MIILRQALDDYLRVRRALGYKLERSEKLLAQFLTFVEDRDEDHVTIDAAVAWASLPADRHRSWMSTRLSVVRRFAIHLHGIDPANQAPPTDLLPGRNRRATPYLYSEADVAALIRAAGTLRTSHQVATYRTLIGLLAVTGMRVGEAIGLDRADLDASNGVLTIRNGKFGKSRELPLHPSTVTALGDYLDRDDRPHEARNMLALLVSTTGTKLLYTNVQSTFHRLVRQAGLQPRSAMCRPRLHDLRHGFAVNTILDGYRHGGDPRARLALLSTYLGHIDPGKTYWYLSAAPELMSLASERLERHLRGDA